MHAFDPEHGKRKEPARSHYLAHCYDFISQTVPGHVDEHALRVRDTPRFSCFSRVGRTIWQDKHYHQPCVPR
jgi:hypothetical protein